MKLNIWLQDEEERSEQAKPIRESFMNIPKITPINATTGIAVFAGLALVGASIGAAIGTYVFFGTATLLGLVVIIENNQYLRYIASKSRSFIDILIFGATIAATASLGITISASLVFAGLGYTLVYSPYLRSSLTAEKLTNK